MPTFHPDSFGYRAGRGAAEPESAGPPDVDVVSPELINTAKRGDQRAVDRLLGTLRPMIYRYCSARLGHGRILTTPDDVAQEVMPAIFTALPRYQIRPGSTFRAFVLAIAAHKSDRQRMLGVCRCR